MSSYLNQKICRLLFIIKYVVLSLSENMSSSQFGKKSIFAEKSMDIKGLLQNCPIYHFISKCIESGKKVDNSWKYTPEQGYIIFRITKKIYFLRLGWSLFIILNTFFFKIQLFLPRNHLFSKMRGKEFLVKKILSYTWPEKQPFFLSFGFAFGSVSLTLSF